MTEKVPLCPRCGKRITASMAVCPICGFVFLPANRRVRCNRCGHRIPADARICPRCGSDPRARTFPQAACAGVLVLIILLLVCTGWILYRAWTTNLLQRAMGLGPVPTPTTGVTVVFVVATAAPTPQPYPTSPWASPIWQVTSSPSSQVTWSPTRRGAQTLTPTRAATATPASYPAPVLIGPPDATLYVGADTDVVLEWQPVSPNGLAENEWYRVSVSFTTRDDEVVEQIRWSKETRTQVLSAWWNEIAPQARTVRWSVAVVAIDGVNPFSSPNFTRISPPSPTRTFIWN